MPKVHTHFDLPLIKTTTGARVTTISVCVIKLTSLVWVNQTEIISATQEVALVLKTSTDTPCHIDALKRIVLHLFNRIKIIRFSHSNPILIA